MSCEELILHPLYLALQQVLRERELRANISAPAKVEQEDFLLMNIIGFMEKSTFVHTVPLVSKRWDKFRSDDLWNIRCKVDWSVDVSTLRPAPKCIKSFYRRLHEAFRASVRANNVSLVSAQNTVILFPVTVRA